MRRRFRVENLTVNLAERVKVDELLCFTGTRFCWGRTILCLFSNGCCGPAWSNPGGGGTIISGGCGVISNQTITDCFTGTRCGHVISDHGTGCGVNFSTCPGGSIIDFGEMVDVFDDLKVELDELTAEIAERAPEIQKLGGPSTAAEFDAVEAELKAAMERVQQARKDQGV